MATRRLWIIGLWLFGTSCILAPDIEIDGPEINYPPEIALDLVEPPDSGWFELDVNGEDCEDPEFKLGQVKDRNVTDKFFYAWLINWERGGTVGDEVWYVIHPSGEVARPGPEITVPLADFTPDEQYTVRIFIADRVAELGEDQIIVFPSDPDGQFDSYQWSFVTKYNRGYCIPQ